MNPHTWFLRRAAARWAGPGLLSLLLLPAAGLGAGEGEAAVRLAEFEVVGSRLAGPQGTVPPSAWVFTAEQIERSGATTAGEFLRRLPINYGYADTYANPVNFNGAQSNVGFRGLGPVNTLVLINGRRAPNFGQASGPQLAPDVGNLPSAAVESIEVLRDGASALYGSDAVAGVVNVRLRRQFTGARVRVRYGQFEDSDWSRREVQVTAGAARGGVSALVVASYAANNGVTFADRPVSRSEDFRSVGGQDFRQNFGMPGQVVVPVDAPGVPPELTGTTIAPGTVQNGVVTLRTTATPRLTDFVPLPLPLVNGRPVQGDSRNNFDRAPWTTFIPGEEGWAGHLFLDAELTPRLAAFLDAGWHRRVLTSAIHPSPASLLQESAPGAGDGPNGEIIFPASNPYNPFGVDITNLRFHLVELGGRIREYTTDSPRLVAGLRGTFGDGGRWEIATQRAGSRVVEKTQNYITDRDLQNGLAGRLGGFINPFGPSDPGVIDRARTGLRADQSTRLQGADALVQATLWELPAGPLRAVAGAEVRTEDYRGEPSDLAAAGAYVAWAAFSRFRAGRDSRAGFVEAAVPVWRTLDVQVAARADHTNDFGTAVKPRYAASWRVHPTLLLHGSRSESFRAPGLFDLYSNQTEIYTVINDPRRPDLGAYSIRYRYGSNPDLGPEESVSDYLGAAWTPPGVAGVMLSAAQWRIRQQGLVGSLGLNFILAREGSPDFPTASLIVRAPGPAPGVPGEIILARDTAQNIDEVATRGWDFDARWEREVGDAGTFRVSGSAVLLESLNYVSRTAGRFERAGTSYYPRWRANAVLEWERGGTTVTFSGNYIGAQRGNTASFTGDPGNLGPRWFANLHVSRALSADTRATFAVTNLLDANPPRAYGSSRGYDPPVYDNFDRAFFLGLERSF